MNSRLTRSGKKVLRKASRNRIEAYFADFPPVARTKKWLKKNNPYRIHCTDLYAKSLAASAVDHSALLEYVAASGPTHVVDGWSLLARAIEAAFRGDTYSAIHFGYYAELRAAMGLLGCEGIGVFNNKHPIVDQHATTHLVPNGEIKTAAGNWQSRALGTHAVVWPTLNHWAGLQPAADLLGEMIRPDGIELADWFAVSGKAMAARAIAQRWFDQWGLDLELFDDDHDSRNLASYRPSELRPSKRLDPAVLVEFVEDLWSLFEPGAARRFPVLERHLVRKILKANGCPVPSAAKLGGLGLDEAAAKDWNAFLGKNDELLPLKFADQSGCVEDAHCHLQIISRAALLLSVATSAARRLLINASYDNAALGFWWRRHGSTRGFWDDNASPEDPMELWADIEQSLQDARTWRVAAGSLRSFRQGQAGALDHMGGFELAGIWGLLP